MSSVANDLPNGLVQLIRSVVQSFWVMVLGLGLVDGVLANVGIPETAATAIAIPLSMSIVIGAMKLLPASSYPMIGKALETVLSLIPGSPKYTDNSDDYRAPTPQV